MSQIHHTSVLLQESIAALQSQPGRVYVDGTLGGGGHASVLCQQLDASNTFVGIDQDQVALARAKTRLAEINAASTLHLLQGNFSQLSSLLAQVGIFQLDGGLLLDLGVSDFQIKDAERGFSFQHDAPLDMRMDTTQPITAANLVNTLEAHELADLFFAYGDERLSRPMARAIVEARPIETTLQLAAIAKALYQQRGVKAKNIHPATRIFQALRMAVNQEQQVLTQCLNQLPALLTPGARVAIITFHSGEDRTVKQFFREVMAFCLCPPQQPICTCNHQPSFKAIGKPITASEEELKANPQSRSAKLRVYERV